MQTNMGRTCDRWLTAGALLATVSSVTLMGVQTARADDDSGLPFFLPFNLAVTRSVYVDTGSITAGTTVLPPNCSPANCPTPVTAVTSSAYPYVFNNDTVDGNFGITSKIFLDQVTPFGWLFSSFEVPNSSQHGSRAEQRSNGHQLLLKIGIGGEPVDRRRRPDLHGLFRAHRRD